VSVRPSTTVAAILCGTLTALAAVACGDSAEQARLKATTQANYDRTTGKLTELTYDRDKNGKIDTWVQMDGATPVSARIDTDEDGVFDRWEYYEAGKLVRVEWERPQQPGPDGVKPPLTGKPNTISYLDAEGRVDHIDYFETSNVTGQRGVVRREIYVDGKYARAEEDTDGDGLMDRFDTFDAEGHLKTSAFDDVKPYDGKPDKRFTYDATGNLVLIETDPDGAGGYRKSVVPGKK
jgi:hypothetical protein